MSLSVRLPQMAVLMAVLCFCAVSDAATGISAGANGFDACEVGTYLDFSVIPIPADYFGIGSPPIDYPVKLSPDSLGGDKRFTLARNALSIQEPWSYGVFELSLPVLVSDEIITMEIDGYPSFYMVVVVPDFDAYPGLLALAPGDDGGEILSDGDGDGQADSFFELDYTIYFNETCGCSSRSVRVSSETLLLDDTVGYAVDAPSWADDTDLAAGFFPGVNSAAPQTPQVMRFSGSRLHLAMTLAQPESYPSTQGDANLDGHVDIADFVILKQHYGATDANWSMGDFNDDGKVDIADFVLLKQHYGS